ncbi:hypothetical protein [Halorubrum sp. GN11GM_10-3_MGM]|uniref:hypothetical protein n=1 Tax=Halorubrum sp. GN11GM_10-3_MGM TaxID=2518111 RepID=UPI0010F79298|nr:hypothetical protein [Halorubrum sp. GN11GM_10-3_MGM]TKX70932.1 hypothetical protein EXE40_08530 [Halorubrum sp. GN11GM_10-3_MGM]
MSADSAGERVAARVSDDDLLDALDDAAEDHGSKSEAIRAALRETYGDRDAVGDDVIDAVLPDDPMVKRGYRILVEEAAPFTSRIDVEAAESRIADRTNLPSNVVRRRVINPLARHRVGGDPIVKPVWGVLVVRPPEDLAEFVPTEDDAPSDSPSDDLEELTAAGEAVAARRGDRDA